MLFRASISSKPGVASLDKEGSNSFISGMHREKRCHFRPFRVVYYIRVAKTHGGRIGLSFAEGSNQDECKGAWCLGADREGLEKATPATGSFENFSMAGRMLPGSLLQWLGESCTNLFALVNHMQAITIPNLNTRVM